MSEQLGEAVLTLRTNDQGLDAGIALAKSKSEQLGRTLDATSKSAFNLMTSLNQASPAAQRLAGEQAKLNAVTGAQRAGMQQLGMQLGDMATMYALGARPMQIFASQMGQVIGAVQLMTGGTSKLAAFLGGPWGIALSVGAIVLTPLISNLLSADKAMGQVEQASDGLADAQGVLGGMFDLTTGKIKNQNEMLRLNAQLLAINLRSQASSERATSRETLGFSGSGLGLSWTNRALGFLGVPVQGAFGRAQDVAAVAAQVNAVNPTDKGAGERLGALAKQAEKLDFSGLSITKEEFLNAISSRMSAALKDKTASAIEKSLADNILDPSLRVEGRDKKGPKSKSGKTAEEIAAEQAAEIERLGQEELRAKLALATTAEDRRAIALDLLQAERDQRVREIEANKDLSDAQKRARLDYIDRLYGKPPTVNADGSIAVNGGSGLLGQKEWADFEAEAAKQANDMLSRQADTISALADLEPNLRERARLEAEALKLQQQIQRNLLEQQIASGAVADAEQARALLAQQQAAAQQQLARRNLSPGRRYADEINNEAANINDAIESIHVRGLERLNDELTDAVMGTKSLGSAFKAVANQIIADLIRISIRQGIIGPLASLLFGGAQAGGGGGGLFGSMFGGLFGGIGGMMAPIGDVVGGDLSGGGTPTMIDMTKGWDYNPVLSFSGPRATGGLIPRGTFGIVGDAGPEPIIATAEGAQVLPNSSLRQMERGGGPGTLEVNVSGARGNREIMEMVRAGVAQGLAQYDEVVADRVQDKMARFGQ